MLQVITSGNAEKKKGVAAAPWRPLQATAAVIWGGAVRRGRLSTANPAADLPTAIPSQSRRNVTRDLSDEIDSAEQGAAGYDPQVVAMHTPPHAATLSSTARGSSPEP